MNPLIVEDLASLIEGEGIAARPVGGVGGDLFLGLMPNSPDDCVALIEMAGRVPEFLMGAGGMSSRRPMVRIVARSRDYEAARRRIEQIYELFVGTVDLDVGTHRYHTLHPQTEPRSGGPDGQDRERIYIDVDVRMQP